MNQLLREYLKEPSVLAVDCPDILSEWASRPKHILYEMALQYASTLCSSGSTVGPFTTKQLPPEELSKLAFIRGFPASMM
jgi:hypothetical protein